MCLLLDNHRVVPTLEEMPGPPVTPVEVLGIPTVQVSQTAGKARLPSRLDEDVEVSAHQTVGVAHPAAARNGVSKPFQKQLAVDIMSKDSLSTRASSRDVI